MTEVEIEVPPAFGVKLAKTLSEIYWNVPHHYEQQSYDDALRDAVERVAHQWYGIIPVDFRLFGEKVTHISMQFAEPQQALLFRLKHG